MMVPTDGQESASVYSSRPYLITLLIAVVLNLGLRQRIIEHVLMVQYNSHWLLLLIQRSLLVVFAALFLAFCGVVLMQLLPGWRRGSVLTRKQLGWLVQLASGMTGTNLLSENLAIYRANLSSYSLMLDSLMLYLSICFIFLFWYWFVDNPLRRRGLLWERQPAEPGSLSMPYGIVFPEETLEREVSQSDQWQPGFVDYAYFAILSSNCFGPPEGHLLVGGPVKLLHILHSFAMIIVFIVILARAINTLA